jgi:hypothetical protein
MAGRSLRAQLNQVRAWVREGRTDAWIAHQLEVPASELRDFRRRHGLTPDDEPDTSDDLRDEIEAEVEAATLAAAEAEEEEEAADDEDEERADAEDAEDSDDGEDGDEGDDPPRRRRRRRGGRGRGRGGRGGGGGGKTFEGTFDHGEKDGYGLWLDPSVKDDPVYTENWAGNRSVEVAIEADRIVIRRVGG